MCSYVLCPQEKNNNSISLALTMECALILPLQAKDNFDLKSAIALEHVRGSHLQLLSKNNIENIRQERDYYIAERDNAFDDAIATILLAS